MKILYHHRTLGDGAEGIHIREMVRAFRDLGHEVRVIGPTGEELPQQSARSKGLGAIKDAMPRALFELMEIAYTGYAFLRTLREISRFRPDFIYDRYITFNAGVTLAGRARRVPVCLEVNAPLALERSEQQDETLIFRRIAFAMERWICAHATRTITVSTPLREYLESIGVPHGQCEVMANGVDPVRFAPQVAEPALRAKLGIPADSFVVGFTGVLRPWHGLDLLLDAVAPLVRAGANIALLIVGDGPYRQTLESRSEALGLKRSLFITGRVAHDEVPRYVALCDVAVSPRATFYASPMKVIEYMALGKPVLVPGTANFLDIVDDNINGVTFKDGDAAAMGAALAQLHQAPERCRALGQEARRKVESRLNWRWNAQRSCELIAHPSGASRA